MTTQDPRHLSCMNHEQVKGLNGYDTWQSPIDGDPLKHVQSWQIGADVTWRGSRRDPNPATKKVQERRLFCSSQSASLHGLCAFQFQSPFLPFFCLPPPDYDARTQFLMQISLNQTLTHCWSINNAKVSVRTWHITALDDRQQAKLINCVSHSSSSFKLELINIIIFEDCLEHSLCEVAKVNNPLCFKVGVASIAWILWEPCQLHHHLEDFLF